MLSLPSIMLVKEADIVTKSFAYNGGDFMY